MTAASSEVISAILIGILVLFIIIFVCCMCMCKKDGFKDFPGATLNGKGSFADRPFGAPWNQSRPLHGPNQNFSQWKTPSFKGTSLQTVDQLTTGRHPIVIEWGKNWYNVP